MITSPKTFLNIVSFLQDKISIRRENLARRMSDVVTLPDYPNMFHLVDKTFKENERLHSKKWEPVHVIHYDDYVNNSVYPSISKICIVQIC